MKILKILQQKQQSPQKRHDPVVPSGLIAHTEKGYFYIKGAKKFKFASERSMLSWGLPVISTTEDKISNLKLFGVLGFRDGTLIKDISDGKIYLISDSKRRHVTEPEVLEWLDSKIIEVGQKEISIHDEGEKL